MLRSSSTPIWFLIVAIINSIAFILSILTEGTSNVVNVLTAILAGLFWPLWLTARKENQTSTPNAVEDEPTGSPEAEEES